MPGKFYHKNMLKRFAHLFAYLLLVMLPLQSIAAANMLVCNSMMQRQVSSVPTERVNSMPCHEHMADMVTSSHMETKHKNSCKSTCGALCSTLCAMTALPNSINTTLTSTSSPLVSLAEQSYSSVTLPNTQRPPIFLS